MLGAIIGDIVGSTYEFNNTKDYNFKLFPEGSNYTDDTITALAVASWLINDLRTSNHDPDYKYDCKNLIIRLLEVCEKYPNPLGGYGSGFHTWLFDPKNISYGADAPYNNYAVLGERRPYNSCGNGSAMRVAPIGWFYNLKDEDSDAIYNANLKLTLRAAALSAMITHNHNEGIKGAQAVAEAVYLARIGKSKEEIKNNMSIFFKYDLSKSWRELHDTYSWNGTCQGTVPQALICFLESNNFEDAIRKAVSIGGDSDTLACITGGIAEAYYKEIPSEMAQTALNKLPKDLSKIFHDFINKVDYDVKFI